MLQPRRLLCSESRASSKDNLSTFPESESQEQCLQASEIVDDDKTNSSSRANDVSQTGDLAKIGGKVYLVMPCDSDRDEGHRLWVKLEENSIVKSVHPSVYDDLVSAERALKVSKSFATNMSSTTKLPKQKSTKRSKISEEGRNGDKARRTLNVGTSDPKFARFRYIM